MWRQQLQVSSLSLWIPQRGSDRRSPDFHHVFIRFQPRLSTAREIRSATSRNTTSDLSGRFSGNATCKNFPKLGEEEKGVNSSPSKEGTTVFLRASTSPRGEPNRKKSVTSKSNFPREPPSSMVLLLERLEPASPWSTLEWRLSAEGEKKRKDGKKRGRNLGGK